MASAAVSGVRRGSGRLVVNPTEAFKDGTYPYGGVEVGYARACMVQALGRPVHVQYESLGEAGDILEPDTHYVFRCFLRGWDDDAVRLFLARGYEVGSVSQHATFAVPTTLPGQSALARAIMLAYVPDDPVRVPAILIYRGVPEWDETAEIAFQRQDELGIPLLVECFRDANDNTLRIGRLPDLSLT